LLRGVVSRQLLELFHPRRDGGDAGRVFVGKDIHAGEHVAAQSRMASGEEPRNRFGLDDDFFGVERPPLGLAAVRLHFGENAEKENLRGEEDAAQQEALLRET
jgi:hypothetical protein